MVCVSASPPERLVRQPLDRTNFSVWSCGLSHTCTLCPDFACVQGGPATTPGGRSTVCQCLLLAFALLGFSVLALFKPRVMSSSPWSLLSAASSQKSASQMKMDWLTLRNWALLLLSSRHYVGAIVKLTNCNSSRIMSNALPCRMDKSRRGSTSSLRSSKRQS